MCIELWHEEVNGDVSNGWLVVALLGIYQQSHTSRSGTLAKTLQPLHHQLLLLSHMLVQRKQ